MGAHCVKAVIEKAGIDPAMVDDCIFGAAAQQGTQSYNLGVYVVWLAVYLKPQQVWRLSDNAPQA